MGKIIDFETIRKRAEQSYQVDTKAAWHDFWKEVDEAFLDGAITEAEFMELREEFSDDGFIRSLPLSKFGIENVTEQQEKFIGASTNTEICDLFYKAHQNIRTFTGEDFSMRFGQSGTMLVASLYDMDWLSDSLICAIQVLPFEMEVLLCSGDMQKFCARHKISTLLAKDVHELFLSGLERICRECDITQITLKGDELYNDRWAEHLGFVEHGYSEDGLGLWTKTLG